MARDQREEGEGIWMSSSDSSTTAMQEHSKQNISENQDICCFVKRHNFSNKQQRQEQSKLACSEQTHFEQFGWSAR